MMQPMNDYSDFLPPDSESDPAAGAPASAVDVDGSFGWGSLTYLPQRRRALPPHISETVRTRLPVIADFRILLTPDESGYLAPEFWSGRRGFLARAFPFRDALAEGFPSSAEALLGIGDAASPLVEIELGQELYVWRQATEVLIVAGDPEAEPGSFRVAVRVPEPVFATEWWRLCSVARRYVAPQTGGPVWLRHVDADDDDAAGSSGTDSGLSG